jgi:hypothetical protein
MGDSGSGKTYSIRTAVTAGIEVRAILTEPHARLVLGDIPCPKLHWMYIPPSTGGWEEMIQRADIMTKMAWPTLAKMTDDPKKSSYLGFFKMLSGLHKYKCDRCGAELGDASSWGTNVMLVIDSLTGLNHAAMQMVTGMAIARSQPQWGAAMDSELSLVNKLCMDTHCHLTLIAHADRSIDELSGQSTITPLALGRANRAEFSRNFSDVIYSHRLADRFMWSTANPQVTCLKATHVPISDKLEPNFNQIINTWKSKGGIIESQ